MGCFLACFGGAEDRKQRSRSKKPLPNSNNNNRANRKYQPLQTSPSPPIPAVVKREPNAAENFRTLQKSTSPPNPFIDEVAAGGVAAPEPREKEEQPSSVSCRKKVTFDLNVKTYENVVVDEDTKDSLEIEEGKLISPDPNYRYQHCGSSDDEGIEDDDDAGEFDDSDFDDEDDDVGAEEESYDSFFSLPMDKERQQPQNGEEVDSPVPTSNVPPKGAARDRSQYVLSVLNPVENLSQWKEVKVRALTLKNPNKGNSDASNKENSGSKLETKVTGFSPEPTFKTNKPQKPFDSEISVDASLSTWLVSSETSPKGSSSTREEQPILGALTVEDIKQQSSSVTSSPRRSPSRNPDEIPILGTVGSYWNSEARYSETKCIPNTTSKYREDKIVNWHSTPFEVRLERALNKGAAEASSMV